MISSGVIRVLLVVEAGIVVIALLYSSMVL